MAVSSASGASGSVIVISSPLDQLEQDVDQQIDVGRDGLPVDDRGPEGDAPVIDGGSGEYPAIVQQRLAELAIELIELSVGDAGRPGAKRDDVEPGLGEQLELGLGLDPLREVAGEPQVALDHRAVAVAAVGAQRR